MICAHLPAAYLLTKTSEKIFKIKLNLIIALIAGITPDLDLIYFYLIDNCQHLHHSYWTHIPFYWIAIYFLMLFISKYRAGVNLFFANILLHLMLDTHVGQIKWLFPFRDQYYYLFTVESYFGPSIFNYFIHWTFCIEIIITIIAIIVFSQTNKFNLFFK